MHSRRRSTLVHIIWAIGGAAAGGTVTILFVKGLKPDWIEATGTWFGAIATVLALLWAVQTFRSDQDEREEQRRQDIERAQFAAAAEESAHVAEAAMVSLAIRGGAAYGSPGEQTMTGIHIDIHNETRHVVTIDDFRIEPPLLMTKRLRTPIRVFANETHTEYASIAEIEAVEGQLSGLPLKQFVAKIDYRIGARRWSRTNHEIPTASEQSDS